ncbi:hypothetical protein HN51_007777 [Arachis hypogaea]
MKLRAKLKVKMEVIVIDFDESFFEDVGKICEQVLSLSNNLMSPYKSELPPLESICILVLNNTGADWEQHFVCLYCSSPQRQANNHVSHLPMSSSIVQGFNSLRLLNLDDNCIAECDEVMKLSQLKMVGYGFKYVLNSRLD